MVEVFDASMCSGVHLPQISSVSGREVVRYDWQLRFSGRLGGCYVHEPDTRRKR